jgi:hypothetical protein
MAAAVAGVSTAAGFTRWAVSTGVDSTGIDFTTAGSTAIDFAATGFSSADPSDTPWGYYPDYGYYDYSQPYSQTWYYCSDPAGYYPYVTQCSTGWQAVPAS